MYHKLKNKPEFAFISFTYEAPEVVEQMRRKHNLEFPIISISESECNRLMQNPLYPTNFIIDKKGVIKYYFVGGKTSKQEASGFIETEIYPRVNAELSQFPTN